MEKLPERRDVYACLFGASLVLILQILILLAN